MRLVGRGTEALAVPARPGGELGRSCEFAQHGALVRPAIAGRPVAGGAWRLTLVMSGEFERCAGGEGAATVLAVDGRTAAFTRSALESIEQVRGVRFRRCLRGLD